jgi:hypothetical protein
MTRFLKIALALFVIAVAWILKITTTLVVRLSTQPQQHKTMQLDTINRGYAQMLRGAKMIIMK